MDCTLCAGSYQITGADTLGMTFEQRAFVESRLPTLPVAEEDVQRSLARALAEAETEFGWADSGEDVSAEWIDANRDAGGETP